MKPNPVSPTPPRKVRRSWLVAGVLLALSSGLAAGVGGYTFFYARGASYMTNNPEACANCHVMQGHYNAWTRSSHHAVAVCNDCHTPHQFVGKYVTKAANGWHHSLAFTTGRFKDTIQITERNRKITEAACRHCHGEIVAQIDSSHPGQQALDCLRCHEDVGHLE